MAADPERQLSTVVAQSLFGQAVVADIVGTDGKELAGVLPAQRRDLGNQPDQVRRVDDQVAMVAHVSRRRRQLDLHREGALVADEVSQLAQTALVEPVDRGVDRDGKAARHASLDGTDHAVKRAGLAKFVVLALESVEAEGGATEPGRLGARDVGPVPVPAVGDQIHLDAMVGQALADAIPVRIQSGLTSAQGHPPAAKGSQLVGDAKALVEVHLAFTATARERPAVLAAQIAGQCQFPYTGPWSEADLLENVEHRRSLAPTCSTGGAGPYRERRFCQGQAPRPASAPCSEVPGRCRASAPCSPAGAWKPRGPRRERELGIWSRVDRCPRRPLALERHTSGRAEGGSLSLCWQA